MKLPQITPKQLIYKNIYGYDRLYSKLILSDTDWMTYILLRNILFDAIMCRILQIKNQCSRASSCSA